MNLQALRTLLDDQQMLQHIVNHASYDRGQVATMRRQIGAPPAKSLDMIAFYRTREAKS